MKIKTDKAKDRKAKPLIPLMKNRNSCKVIASSKENKSMNLINYWLFILFLHFRKDIKYQNM